MKIIYNRPIILFLALIFLVTSSCKKDKELPPIDENVDLDGSKINDSSLITPANFLLSAAKPNPTNIDLAMPVVIAVHGYSACTFEWTEFRDWSKTKNNFYVSIVLLGGHGRDYIDFKRSTWQDWQAPIIDEYNKLRNMGYQNINIAASSTGCPLVLNMIRTNKINTDRLKHIYFIDPIIVPANKQLSLAPAIGHFVGYIKTDLDVGENGFWYKYRPEHSLRQLEKFIRDERKELEKGITLPTGTSLKVYKSNKDGSVDPISAVQLQKGVKTSAGSAIMVNMIESNLHVFTRLHGRTLISAADRELQLKTFEEIHSEL